LVKPKVLKAKFFVNVSRAAPCAVVRGDPG
jgi:hypothetical protein